MVQLDNVILLEKYEVHDYLIVRWEVLQKAIQQAFPCIIMLFSDIFLIYEQFRYYREPGVLFKTATVMRTIIFVATRHLNDEELFVK